MQDYGTRPYTISFTHEMLSMARHATLELDSTSHLLTLAEFRSKYPKSKMDHGMLVARAWDRGQYIPLKVLADYPGKYQVRGDRLGIPDDGSNFGWCKETK